MSDKISRLSPSPKAMKQARAWVDTRRTQGLERQSRQNEMAEALREGLQDVMGSMGIAAVQIGEDTLRLNDPVKQSSSVSSRWSDHLATGGQVVVMEVNNGYTGYLDKEHVNPEDRTLEDLIDTDLVARLAPTATLYGPDQEAPWANVFSKSGFQIWITDTTELAALWKNMKQWVRTQWHDDTLRASKYPHDFADIAHITLTRIAAADLDWRVKKMDRSSRLFEQSQVLGAWDAQAQADIKRAIGALVTLEDHPVFGTQSKQWIEQMVPALAYSMEGKKRIKALQQDQQKTWQHTQDALKTYCIDFKDWEPSLPVW